MRFKYKIQEYQTVAAKAVTFTERESKVAHNWLIQSGYLDFDDMPTDKFREEGLDEIAIARLPEAMRSKASAIEALVKSVFDPHALDGMIEDGLATKATENRLNQNFERKAFQELWARINSKYAYTVEFDSAELADKAVKRIDRDLIVSELAYAMTVGAQRSEVSREDVKNDSQFQVQRTMTGKVDAVNSSGVIYDLLGEVASQACITRRSAAAILKRIRPEKFALYAKNPEEFIAKTAKLIVEEKAAMVVEHISYHEIDAKYDSAIFTERMPKNASGAMQVSKGVQDWLFPDSDAERAFAADLDVADEVEVYAKLPRSFKIPTPVGNYAPDWAIAFKQGAVRHVYFVAETKGSLDTLELRGVESAKIACAKRLFNEASRADVMYHEVTSYADLLEIVNG